MQSLDPIKMISLAPALMLAAKNEAAPISRLVMTFRIHGLGGDRACRKLLHRLEQMSLLAIKTGEREDRREKSVYLTPDSRTLLRQLRDILHELSV
jgi:hypothetical protein